MGTYSNLKVKLFLSKKKTPEDVVKFLTDIVCDLNADAYCNNGEYDRRLLPAHEFFDCERWFLALVSTQFGTVPGSSFETRLNGYELSIDTEFQDRDSESEKLVDWLGPFVAGRKKKEFVGSVEVDMIGGRKENIYILREEGNGVFKRVELC